MKNNKYIFKLTGLAVLVASLAVVVIVNKSQAMVPPAVADYLKSVGKSDWAVMALGAMDQTPADVSFLKTIDGATANDYATYILALTAVGKDPRAFGTEDYVASLKNKVVGGQIGEATLISDDMFGLLALRSAGVPATDDLIASEVAYLKSHQLADGGWDFAMDAKASTVDLTAMGIMALRSANVSASDAVLTKASAFLLAAQNSDGGFPMIKGDASNTESTAWALSAIYALGDNPQFWAPAEATPVDYLNGRLQSAGWAAFDQTATAITGRTGVTTAYAAVALAGKFYPVKILSDSQSVNVRIEGREQNLCNARVAGRTALDAARAAIGFCGLTYQIEDTQYGLYLKTIANEEPVSYVGWSFLVNYEGLQVGAADFSLHTDDNIVIYYGNWDDLPLRVTLPTLTPALNAATTGTVEKYDYNQKVWQAAAGASVKLSSSSQTISTDSAGYFNLTWPEAGSFSLGATLANTVRSAPVVVIVNGQDSQQKSVDLSVNIAPTNGATPPPPTAAVAFGISGDLNFGDLAPGQSAAKSLTISNQGSAAIKLTASLAGASLFTQNLRLDSSLVPAWQKSVAMGANSAVNASLTIPANYVKQGKEQGTLIFWANPQ